MDLNGFKDRSQFLSRLLQKAKNSKCWISKLRRSWGLIFGHSIALMSTLIPENMSLQLSLSSEKSWIFDFERFFFAKKKRATQELTSIFNANKWFVLETFCFEKWNRCYNPIERSLQPSLRFQRWDF